MYSRLSAKHRSKQPNWGLSEPVIRSYERWARLANAVPGNQKVCECAIHGFRPHLARGNLLHYRCTTAICIRAYRIASSLYCEAGIRLCTTGSHVIEQCYYPFTSTSAIILCCSMFRLRLAILDRLPNSCLFKRQIAAPH